MLKISPNFFQKKKKQALLGKLENLVNYFKIFIFHMGSISQNKIIENLTN
jgi:hypothetical protein